MNQALFAASDFLSKPPGFYWMLAAMAAATALIPLGVSYNAITYVLSVLAIVITSVVLIQGYRDTAAIQAKLDELILAQEKARNEVVGLEKQEPERIAQEVEKLEREAER
jgi:low affinity Fe/Cu permease